MTDERNDNLTAKLICVNPPDEKQKEGILDFLEKKSGIRPELEIVIDESVVSGFILRYDGLEYDWSASGRARQLRADIEHISAHKKKNIVRLLKETVENFTLSTKGEEVGTVLSVGDGVATVSGLEHAAYGEILLFESGVKGLILDLKRDSIGCVLFGDDKDVTAGSRVARMGVTAGMPAGEGFIGRVVDALGSPIDGGDEIKCDEYMPVEADAPGIIDRQPVDEPMETGILAIDSMFPIGRGQRELIIGDRQTGKTAIATDTILNQKGKDVICVYVAIGQKASSVARLAQTLKKKGAMDYTIIVNASAGEPAPLQYIAPYAGCALAEYFMNRGKDVLIVYDDLSKHAIAYRSLSLLLGRSPGREAYPGDVFYLHSRLLERAAHLSDEKGGGSITALPIVETQAGDVSAYIPTNIISITDGQIFLENELFFSGQRPAVNVGISVSRVGGHAQTAAMKKAVGTLRLDLAQYREMEVFMQFSSDLDENTKDTLAYGRGLMLLLRQPQNNPFSMCDQVIILVAAMKRVFQKVEFDSILSFRSKLLEFFHTAHADVCDRLTSTKILDDGTRAEIEAYSEEFLKSYKEA